jgi:hypothetical protein
MLRNTADCVCSHEWVVNCFKIHSLGVCNDTDCIIQISIDITMIHATSGAVVAECISSLSRVVHPFCPYTVPFALLA